MAAAMANKYVNLATLERMMVYFDASRLTAAVACSAAWVRKTA